MEEKQTLIKEKALDLISKGLIMEAVKFVRDETGAALVDAKKLVDKLIEENKKIGKK
ncbi:MAG: hypothetical protein OHK0045_25320 [Raineya sp.]